MSEVDVYIALGSNIGPRAEAIESAISSLKMVFGALRASSVYETEPRIDEEQPAFLNAVVHVRSASSPTRILGLLMEIEEELGRTRDLSRPKGPRTLDLDLLYVGQERQQTETLTLPHPGIASRRFVLAPLNELAPDFAFGGGPTVREMLALCPDAGWVRVAAQAPRKVAS